MDDKSPHPPTLAIGMTPEHARQMFRRTLASWAGDMLSLRSRGLDRPGRRRSRKLVAAGWAAAGQGVSRKAA